MTYDNLTPIIQIPFTKTTYEIIFNTKYSLKEITNLSIKVLY